MQSLNTNKQILKKIDTLESYIPKELKKKNVSLTNDQVAALLNMLEHLKGLLVTSA
jgi:hypothetical protein